MFISNRSLEWILNPRYRWLQHLIFWSIMYMPHLAAFTGLTQAPLPAKLIPLYLAVLSIDVLVVYFNLYILIPRFFLRSKFWGYILSTFGLLLVNATFSSSIQQFILTGKRVFNPDMATSIESFVLTFTLMMTAVGFNITKRFLISQARLKELETTSLKTELAFLKHQINPHFLFNSLNNIYVQSRTNSSDASESILQLSDLLRYQLYDCAKDRVKLSDEIDYLKNYLDIDRMRKNHAEVDFEVSGSPTNIQIAPYLFIPFVENALKHGITLNNETKIGIRFTIKPERILFEIENSKPEQPFNQNMKGGIGLANISRRLDLLYPGKYRLDIDNEKNVYKVKLGLTP